MFSVLSASVCSKFPDVDPQSTDDCEDLLGLTSSSLSRTSLEIRGSLLEKLRVLDYGDRVLNLLEGWPEGVEGPSGAWRTQLGR